MKSYLGVKLISAMAALATEQDRRGEYQVGAEGYKVVYEDGYESWSPKAVFEAAYRETSGLTFGLAIEALKLGKKVARAGWNGKGMWLSLITDYDVNDPVNIPRDSGHYLKRDQRLLPWIGMKTADDKFVPWLASQTDMLADDWQIVE